MKAMILAAGKGARVRLEDVLAAPNWTIEILSPDQSSNRVTGNIFFALPKAGLSAGLVN
ncbi:MAG: hypothetical protein MJA27_12475 [Pseudanabaenales cyanobacterium]|nr:hypothetical protein [Pseudanabaenales cyanobacterium]